MVCADADPHPAMTKAAPTARSINAFMPYLPCDKVMPP
jgi:hypothetical protein